MPRTYTEWFLLLLLAIGILVGILHKPLLAFVLIAVDFIIAVISYEGIAATRVAMPFCILGGRYNALLYEGLGFVLPGLETLISDTYTPRTKTSVYKNVRCMLETPDGKKISGGEVDVEVTTIYGPDARIPQRFRMWIDKGGVENTDEKIEVMIDEMLETNIRQRAADMTWEDLMFSKEEISVHLISYMTGITPAFTGDEATDAEITKEFLKSALTNGECDIQDLGTRIYRLLLSEVVLRGELEKNANRAAEELLQRTADKTDVDTGIQLANAIYDAAVAKNDTSMTYEKAYAAMQVERGRATKTIVTSSGNPMLDAVAAFQNPPPPKIPESNNNA